MCGIVGVISKNNNVGEFLIQGLEKLEYRGYDSAGLALFANNKINTIKEVGKVENLKKEYKKNPIKSTIGIAHTRWATHGKTLQKNAHPHLSNQKIAVVHNGIIENYKELKEELIKKNYEFISDTDTEVIAHLVYENLKTCKDLLSAVQKTRSLLKGAYGTVIFYKDEPQTFVVARSGSPLVIGHGENENLIASDQIALLAKTNQFTYLEEGDVAKISTQDIEIFDINNQKVKRKKITSTLKEDINSKGEYEHFMLKEIFEQPIAVANTLTDRLDLKTPTDVFSNPKNKNIDEIFKKIEYIKIIACGTSYNAGFVAKYFLEKYAKITTSVEIASEYRYRDFVVPKNALLVTISQSGETADTLAALLKAKEKGFLATLSICNSDGSSLVRESDFNYMMKAGVEIGVASTKAFSVQLCALLLLAKCFAKKNIQDEIDLALHKLPLKIEQILKLSPEIKKLAKDFLKTSSALFLGRGALYPIAIEGALKLKEISYIHAESYAAGELKHGPLALVDEKMPVVLCAPNDYLLDKVISNLEEVRARGGQIFVFSNSDKFITDKTQKVIKMQSTNDFDAPIIYSIALQLLSYYVALERKCDIDKPRNLAKSVTVE